MFAQTGISHLLTTLPINIEQHIFPLVNGLFHRAMRASVKISKHLSMLEHFIVFNQYFKGFLIDKHVILPINLSGARRPCGGRNRKLDFRIPNAKFAIEFQILWCRFCIFQNFDMPISCFSGFQILKKIEIFSNFGRIDFCIFIRFRPKFLIL